MCTALCIPKKKNFEFYIYTHTDIKVFSEKWKNLIIIYIHPICAYFFGTIKVGSYIVWCCLW